MSAPNSPAQIRTPYIGLWISSDQIINLPISGPAWERAWDAAQENTDNPDIYDNGDRVDVYLLAKALLYVRTGEIRYREEVVRGIMAAVNSPIDVNVKVLPVARNLQGITIAADLVNLPVNPEYDIPFRAWLQTLRNTVFDAGDGYSIQTCHETRPNNWGTHCGAARVATSRYLGQTADVAQAAVVFKGFLGDTASYANFRFNSNDMSWHCDAQNPVGINPPGCTINGHPAGGIVPDDQRRGGSFTWPPPRENYAWEGLQGAIAQAKLLQRAGYPTFDWQDQALLRAATWLHEEAHFPPEGDDRWMTWLLNDVYGTGFPADLNATPGKGVAWTNWTNNQPPVLRLTPTESILGLDETIEITAEIYFGTQPVDHVSLYINFDPSVLQVEAATATAALNASPIVTYDNGAGTLNVSGSINQNLGGTMGEPTDTTSIVQIQFKSVGYNPGSSLYLSNTEARQSNVHWQGVPVLQQLQGAVIRVYRETFLPFVDR